jgi:hypothetical protein
MVLRDKTRRLATRCCRPEAIDAGTPAKKRGPYIG